MHRTATVASALLATALLAAGAPPAHARRTAPAPAAPAAAVAAHQARKPNLRACFDGKCTITVTRPVGFRISGRYGFTRVSVARRPGLRVRVTARGRGVFLTATIDRYGLAMLNDLSVRILAIDRAKARLRFAPVR